MIQVAPLLIAQITDTHLFADASQEFMGVSTTQSLQTVIKRLQEFPLDALLLTGDLSQDETPESYHRLASLLTALEIPIYWLPGNHDCLPVMAQVLNQPPFSPAKSFQVGNWHFLLLSTAAPGFVHGVLSPESLQWLDSQLQQIGDRPAIVALHHPPLPIHSEWMDRMLLHNPEEFLTIIDRYSSVKIVLSGHIHQAFNQQRCEVSYLGTPSTCVQFKPQLPNLVIDPISPGFRLLTLAADGTWETKVERV
ncbi:MAG: 3',5'-cyclic-AMP phosphodiesterase [Actinomycetota bacterium]